MPGWSRSRYQRLSELGKQQRHVIARSLQAAGKDATVKAILAVARQAAGMRLRWAIGELYRDARTSMAESVRHLVEAGHRLIAKKAEVDHGQWLPWLEANADVLGFETPRTPQRLMALAAKCDVNVAFDDDKALQASRQIWGNNNVRGTQGTGEFEWYTPAQYLDLAREVLGEIDLDPASSDAAQRAVKAAKYFKYVSEEDNGLTKPWHGRVWLNPPYMQPAIADFMGKIVSEYASGREPPRGRATHRAICVAEVPSRRQWCVN